MGEGRVAMAKRLAKFCTIFGAALVLSSALFIYVGKNFIISSFSHDPKVVQKAPKKNQKSKNKKQERKIPTRQKKQKRNGKLSCAQLICVPSQRIYLFCFCCSLPAICFFRKCFCFAFCLVCLFYSPLLCICICHFPFLCHFLSYCFFFFLSFPFFLFLFTFPFPISFFPFSFFLF